ncbi:MAG: pyridine nucleotide-disulfide oxidoreductase [Coxiellaceae bacterium]|nr:pyridine nucleotide-disulfide oxidoreductase [Coxiellaceae bacterium]
MPKEKATEKKFAWAVVGAGPAGMTAVGLLLDSGVTGDDILWIDPHFQAGDFGRFWGEVNSNTRVTLFRQFLLGVSSFDYKNRPKDFLFDHLDDAHFTTLQNVTDPLLWVTEQLVKKVVTEKAEVHSLKISDGAWQINTSKTFFSEKVILAVGSEAKSLDHPGIEKISMMEALTPSILKTVCKPDDVVAVFGSSHSAMIAVRNLVECGVKNIVNFYQSPLRYAVIFDDWILYDDTGLKGETAAWVRENISKKCLPQITRHLATEENLDQFLSGCNKAIYAVGFQQRHIPVSGVFLSRYDVSNGIIAPGLFGAGIGFPIVVDDPFGRQEANVGLWKFLKNMRRTLPLWRCYGL